MKKVLLFVAAMLVVITLKGYLTGEPQVEKFITVTVEEGQDWGDFIGDEYAKDMQALNPTVKELKPGVEVMVPVFKK